MEPLDRKLAAILCADLAGYGRLMGDDEDGTVTALERLRQQVVEPTIRRHRGRLVKTAGDGFLVAFGSALDAVRCADEWQRGVAADTASMAAAHRLVFRIGINLGDVIERDGDVFGDGVNVAARLQELAAPGGIAVSDAVYQQVAGRSALGFAELGPCALKNIAREISVWSAAPDAAVAATPRDPPLCGWDKPSIAVLAFTNLGGDPAQAYFSDGIAEDIVTALSHFRELAVIAGESSFAIKGKTANLRAVARHLGVRYVLTGSVRRGGERVRIAVQLIDAASGEQIWAESFDRTLDDIFAVQDEIARQVVATIAPEITRAEQRRIGRLPPQALRAYDLALQALTLGRQGRRCADVEVVEQAAALAERAATVDPTSPPALQSLAFTHTILADMRYFAPGWRVILDKAYAAADALCRLDPTNAVAYHLLGHVAINRQQPQEALAHLRHAHELNPNDTGTLRMLAWAENNLGLTADAKRHAELTLRLSPQDPARCGAYWALAFAAFLEDKPAEGARWARQAIEDNPDYYYGYAILAACLAEAGEADAARDAIAFLLQRQGPYIRSRLAGNNFFGVPDLGRKYTAALRRAAGSLLTELEP
jgi:adenylate cyclase